MYYSQSAQEILQNLSKSMPQQEVHSVKVNGRAGAEAFSLPPNSDDILLDQNDPII